MDILWTIVIILIVLWVLGIGFNIAGGLVHLLLILVVIILIVKLINSRGKL